MTESSKLRMISIGIAAENKALNSREIQVVPIEIVPLIEGDIFDHIEESLLSGQDRLDRQYTVLVKNSTTITAEWLPHATNRVTPPDIRRGERVMIWQVADQDKYYWQETGMDDDLRRLETVLYAFSATSDETVELNPADNMYTFEVSAHGQHITLKTTDVEGEATTYQVQFNLKTGDFYLVDKQGNTISINSTAHQIFVKNADGCQVHLNKKNLEGQAPKDVDISAGGSITLKGGGGSKIKMSGGFVEIN